MKVAIINSVNKVRSTGRISYDLCKFLKSHGHDSCVFYGRYKNEDGYYFGSKVDFLLHSLLSRMFGMHACYSRIQTKKLIKKLKKYNPDVFVINNLHGYYLNFYKLMHYLAKTNKKIIFVFHDSWNMTGHCSNFSNIDCHEWQNGCKKCKHRRLYPTSWFFDNTALNFIIKKKCFEAIKNKTIVCPSNWLKEIVKQSFLGESNIETIHNGIDVNVFKKKNETHFRDKYGLKNKKIILSIAYFFGEKKGIFDILKLSKLIDLDTFIIVVGNVDKKIVLPENIINIKKTDNIEDLIDIYSSADVFFNATHEDNYPTVNLEALSCLLPVVSYKAGGSCELIDPSFSIDIGDITSAFEAISDILEKRVNYSFPKKNDLSNIECFNQYLKLILGD